VLALTDANRAGAFERRRRAARDACRPVAFEGFLVEEGRGRFARLAGLAVDRDGSVLVADDSNGVLYRVSRAG